MLQVYKEHIEDVKRFKEVLGELTNVALDYPEFGDRFFNEPIKIEVMGIKIDLENNAQLFEDVMSLLHNYMEEWGA